MSRTEGRGLYFVKKAYEEHQPCAATNCRPVTHVRSYRRCVSPIGPKILLVLLDHYTRAKGCAETSVTTNAASHSITGNALATPRWKLDTSHTVRLTILSARTDF